MTATAGTRRGRCRSCGAGPLDVFLSLGRMPLPDAFLTPAELDRPESRFPLDVAFCSCCSLVQLVGDVAADMMFGDSYLYFSSFSDQLLDHARQHALELIDCRDLGPDSLVVELASNDGYFLRNFVEKGIPVLGIDPSPEPAAAARQLGIPVLEEYFGLELAERLVGDGTVADVVVANNVMAHVPDLNGFVGGMAHLVATDGLITIENPYVRDLIDHGAFDTIYHEHVCYYSCTSVDRLVTRHGLHLNHVEEFPGLHGGTLRWHVSPREGRSDEVLRFLAAEQERGMTSLNYYEDFGNRVESIRTGLVSLLTALRHQGSTIAAYGAAAKGTIMLNHAGIGTDLVDFVVDRNVHKQGLFMPGVRIPILSPEALLEHQPDYTLLLAWNFTEEIVRQQSEYLRRGGRFVRPVPTPEVLT